MAAERALLGGRWELGTAIGTGGFATVYRAHDRQTGAAVAVKVVPPGLGPEDPRSSGLSSRLWTEGTMLKRLSSRFVAKVYDVGQDTRGAWLVMELVDGVPLAPASLGRALLPHEVLRVARGLLEGLASAHAIGIVHGDVKPSNVLVPLGKDGLDAPKLIDFGLARYTSRAEVAHDLGETAPASGVVLGTARYMAPEVLRGARVDRRSDLYGAGLVLFELLGEGPLFSSVGPGEQLRARVSRDPELADRVPMPLSAVLAKMLARDPTARFEDAADALAAIVDLDTAPVSIVGDELPPQSLRRAAAEPSSRRISSDTPASRPTASPPASLPFAPPTKLSSLPSDPLEALRETLRSLDLAMIDALARRERANVVGRIARAVALTLRLELDAAALVLEPLALQSDVARAVGATLLGPRARRVTRARVDSDRVDGWLDTLPAELAGLFAAFGAALGRREEAERAGARCVHALGRLQAELGGEEAARRIEPLRVTLRIAIAASRVLKGELEPGSALDLLRPLSAAAEGPFVSPFDRVARAIAVAAIQGRGDAERAELELERAARTAEASGATLLEVVASASWGRLLVESAARADRGLAVLDRVSTLLAHGDVPSIEHEAEHHKAAALLVLERWPEALAPLERAREAAHAERSLELEVASASLSVFARVAVGDLPSARETASVLGDARLRGASGRAAAFAWLARSLLALVSGDMAGAEAAISEARARAREIDDGSDDAFLLVEVLELAFDTVRSEAADAAPTSSEPASRRVERLANGRGFTAFYWFDVLRAALAHVPNDGVRSSMRATFERVASALAPSLRLARERPTSAPPPP